MARAAITSPLRPEFDDFLYASIGQDNDGIPLSVLSVLARMNLDPWVEAAELAGLPEEKAKQRLTAVIAVLPTELIAARDAGIIAARLIERLPGRAVANTVLRGMLDVEYPSTARALRYGMLMGAILSGQWIVTSCQPPTPIDKALPPTAGTTSLDVPLANSGQNR